MRASFVVRCLFSIAVLLGGVSYYALVESYNVSQLRIQYEGSKFDVPDGTLSSEIVKANCEKVVRGDDTKRCQINVQVPKDMKGPVFMYYTLFPFYQNHNNYMQSEVVLELEGAATSAKIDGLRNFKCSAEETRIDGDGNNIVPCGLKAASFFNDTYEISIGNRSLDINDKGISWTSDRARYENPADYLKRPKTSWLYQRYDDVVSQENGVNDEHFINWMRPSGTPRAVKLYGTLQAGFGAGQTLTVVIDQRYPTSEMEVSKELILTTLNSMGGRNDGLGLFLRRLAVGCLLLIVLVLMADQIAGRMNMNPRE